MSYFDNDPRNPSNYSGVVSCLLCGAELLDDDYHECEEITDET